MKKKIVAEIVDKTFKKRESKEERVVDVKLDVETLKRVVRPWLSYD